MNSLCALVDDDGQVANGAENREEDVMRAIDRLRALHAPGRRGSGQLSEELRWEE